MSSHYVEEKSPLPASVMAYVRVGPDEPTVLQTPAPTPAKSKKTEPIAPTKLKSLLRSDDEIKKAVRVVNDAGLTVIATSRLGLAVVGPPSAYKKLTGAQFDRKERLMHAEAGVLREVTHLDLSGKGQPDGLGVGRPVKKETSVSAVILEQPRIALAGRPSPVPPPTSKYHLRVPDDVATLLQATRAHRSGLLGNGVTVAMVDTGHYAHPFFRWHEYRVERPVAVVPDTDPLIDPVGHGTGESANLFAVAPCATLRPYRASDKDGRLVGAVAAFILAKQGWQDDQGEHHKPHIISCSWGGDGHFPPASPPRMQPYEWAFAAEILDAIDQGIHVVFAAGNGSFSVEPQVEGVLSAGGVFVSPTLSPSASDYASGYRSPFYKNRTVPDICGLVGRRPRAQYLMLPVPPGCLIDVDEAEAWRGDPPDGTGAADGWALFSGTSAAAPQVAGAAALLVEARNEARVKDDDLPPLSPADLNSVLMHTAVDISKGSGHPRFNSYARVHADVATGSGLLNVSAAVDRVRSGEALATPPDKSGAPGKATAERV